MRSSGARSNLVLRDFADHAGGEGGAIAHAIPDDVFEELERWHDVLKPHADELRGPRP